LGRRKLEMPHEKLLTDIRLLNADDRLISGADVYLYVTRRIWWAWPFYAIFSLPGFNRLIQVGVPVVCAQPLLRIPRLPHSTR